MTDPPLTLAPRSQVCLAPSHPLETFDHQPLGLRGLRLLHRLPKMARSRPRVHLLQQLLAKLLPG